MNMLNWLCALSLLLFYGGSVAACPEDCSVVNVKCDTNNVTLKIPDKCSGDDCDFRWLNQENKDVGEVPSGDPVVPCILPEYRIKIHNIPIDDCIIVCYRLSNITSAGHEDAPTNDAVHQHWWKILGFVLLVIAAVIIGVIIYVNRKNKKTKRAGII